MTATAAEDLRRILAQKLLREMEALRLYEPLPSQDRFLRSACRQRLARGSNRSGKTLVTALEVSRAVTGQDPFKKYPARDGRVFAVGLRLDHCGSIMWRKLARPGAFKIIRDAHTQKWRAFRPWSDEDRARVDQARPAPPLIPKRFIESIAWEHKAKDIPKMVRFTTGWELTFYSSESEPPQGADIDLWWFDEEIINESWHPEMMARVLDRHGRGIWSATPQAGTDKLYELHEIAEREEEEKVEFPSVAEFFMALRDNPHINEAEKLQLRANLSEEEAEVRIEGQFTLGRRKVFPEFSMHVHGCEFQVIPREWTCYASIDPGRQVCAVLFGAVPPPSDGDFVYLFDELYITNCNAEIFGQKMAQKTAGINLRAMIIDSHGSRITEMGSGLTVEDQYKAALKRYKVSCVASGHGFTWGSDDVDGGLEAVRDWLRVRDNGTVKLRVMKGRCLNLEAELKRYKYKKLPDGTITDKPEDRGRVHQCANMRYLAAFRPKWYKEAGKKKLTGAIAAFREKQALERKRRGPATVNLGPIGASR